eukprot:1145842-Pelagomonas_calceolata.AAC.2
MSIHSLGKASFATLAHTYGTYKARHMHPHRALGIQLRYPVCDPAMLYPFCDPSRLLRYKDPNSFRIPIY